jgi:hypothetical protein
MRKKWAVCKFVKRGTTGKKVLGSILASTTKGAQLARQRVSPGVIIKDLLISFISLLAGTELIGTSQPYPWPLLQRVNLDHAYGSRNYFTLRIVVVLGTHFSGAICRSRG